MMSSFKANGLGSINLGNGRFYIGPFKNGKFDTSGTALFFRKNGRIYFKNAVSHIKSFSNILKLQS